MVLKTEKCSFSGLRVYPGHGMRLTKQDSSTFLYLNGKCKKLAARAPAKLAWTTTYRKAHKKVRKTRANAREKYACDGDRVRWTWDVGARSETREDAR